MQIRSKLPLFLGLFLAVVGIVMVLVPINYLVAHQNTDYLYLFYWGIGINMIGAALYLYCWKKEQEKNL